MIRKGPSQPKATKNTRGERPVYHPPQEMADPWGHLSEAMKKKIFGDVGPPPPPTPGGPILAEPAPTTNESRSDSC